MNKKILIIDDNEQDRKGIAIALQKDGFTEIASAETGEEGITVAKTFKPDIVIIDVVLKTVDDGIDVCKKVKAIEDLTTKVIIITGHLEAIDADKARTSGASEIIEKVAGFSNIGKTIEGLS